MISSALNLHERHVWSDPCHWMWNLHQDWQGSVFFYSVGE